MNNEFAALELKALRAELSIRTERYNRRKELIASCDREVSELINRLALAKNRKNEMLANIANDEVKIPELQARIDGMRQQLVADKNSDLIAKARRLAEQLRALGYTVTPPAGG